MSDGRKPDDIQDPAYRVPVLKFVIDNTAPDKSVIPPVLRSLPPVPSASVLAGLPQRFFELQRSGPRAARASG